MALVGRSNLPSTRTTRRSSGSGACAIFGTCRDRESKVAADPKSLGLHRVEGKVPGSAGSGAHTPEDDGTFWMEFDDFFEQFTKIYACYMPIADDEYDDAGFSQVHLPVCLKRPGRHRLGLQQSQDLGHQQWKELVLVPYTFDPNIGQEFWVTVLSDVAGSMVKLVGGETAQAASLSSAPAAPAIVNPVSAVLDDRGTLDMLLQYGRKQFNRAKIAGKRHVVKTL